MGTPRQLRSVAVAAGQIKRFQNLHDFLVRLQLLLLVDGSGQHRPVDSGGAPTGVDPSSNEHHRGQNHWPPVGSSVGHARAATWPPLGRISRPPTIAPFGATLTSRAATRSGASSRPAPTWTTRAPPTRDMAPFHYESGMIGEVVVLRIANRRVGPVGPGGPGRRSGAPGQAASSSGRRRSASSSWRATSVGVTIPTSRPASICWSRRRWQPGPGSGRRAS
jgi:hypothetical protein